MEDTKSRLKRYYREDTDWIARINEKLSELDYDIQLSLFKYFKLANDGLARLRENDVQDLSTEE